jgi:hypothetical protein
MDYRCAARTTEQLDSAAVTDAAVNSNTTCQVPKKNLLYRDISGIRRKGGLNCDRDI